VTGGGGGGGGGSARPIRGGVAHAHTRIRVLCLSKHRVFIESRECLVFFPAGETQYFLPYYTTTV